MSKAALSFTFDDGNISTYTNAFPLMKKRGIVGHIAVVTDFVGRDKDHYNWEQIREMTDAAWEVMSHSRTHDLYKLTPEKIEREVVEAKQILNEKGYAAKVFNTPGGGWWEDEALKPGQPFDQALRQNYLGLLPIMPPAEMQKKPIDPYAIGHLQCECYDHMDWGKTIEEIRKAVDKTINADAWCNLLWHDVKGVHVEKFGQAVEYVAERVAEEKVAVVVVSEYLGL